MAVRTMSGQVSFYQLSRKFLDSEQAVAAAPKQIIHYTLAIGHHIGVIDCFSVKLEMSLAGYTRWIEQLPEGEGRRKMEGLLRFGEIEISVAHAGLLQNAFNRGLGGMSSEETAWTTRLNEMLQDMVEEPALYLMVRCQR